MSAPFTHNEKPAARTNRDGLDFVRTTTLTPQKDSDYDLYHIDRARCKPR